MSKIEATHEELQKLEHYTKVLREHREIMRVLTTEVYVELSDYLDKLREFTRELKQVQHDMSTVVNNIYNSVKDMKRVSGVGQDLLAFGSAVQKLDAVLTDEVVQKVLKVLK